MKTIIASAIVAISFAAPAAADISAKQFFALGNDSAAERVLGDTSQGDISQAQRIGAKANESAAERQFKAYDGVASRNQSILNFFAMGNDSAAEM